MRATLIIIIASRVNIAVWGIKTLVAIGIPPRVVTGMCMIATVRNV